VGTLKAAEAFDVVRQRGGTPSPAVTKRTQVLIVGELGWPLLDDGRPSNKLSRATEYGIPVVSERRFLSGSAKPSLTVSRKPIRPISLLA
jgi:NAD-dependent DNA ligase